MGRWTAALDQGRPTVFLHGSDIQPAEITGLRRSDLGVWEVFFSEPLAVGETGAYPLAGDRAFLLLARVPELAEGLRAGGARRKGPLPPAVR